MDSLECRYFIHGGSSAGVTSCFMKGANLISATVDHKDHVLHEPHVPVTWSVLGVMLFLCMWPTRPVRVAMHSC